MAGDHLVAAEPTAERVAASCLEPDVQQHACGEQCEGNPVTLELTPHELPGLRSPFGEKLEERP